MKKPTVAIETINPQIASQWIERIHPDNRKLRSRRVNQYAADMRNQKWYLSNDAIVWGEDGYISNAAHRLHAIIASGTQQEFIVLRHAPDMARIVMDSGAKRSTDENFRMAGLEYIRNCGSTVRSLMQGFTQAHVLVITDQEVAEFMANNGEAIEFAHLCLPKGTVSRAQTRAVIARARLKRITKEKLERFCSVLLSGQSMSKEEVVIVKLRNLFLDKDTRKGSFNRRAVYGKTERALKAYLDEEQVGMIYQPSEELFPIRSIDNFGAELAENGAES